MDGIQCVDMSLFSILFPNDTQFPVAVYDKKGPIYQGKVWAISSNNAKGPFSIRTLHTNFITVIEKELILRFDKKKFQTITVDLGVLRCYDQRVDIYLGISRLPQELTKLK